LRQARGSTAVLPYSYEIHKKADMSMRIV